jgi:succinate dehydrogenase/fumarate reductase flavoprotein subunit
MKVDTVEADVLCVGGGIAGLMAAIRASELGAKVIVAEKGNTLRSGSGATGNDHFHCYIPEIHGTDIQLLSTGMNMRQARAWFEYTPKIVKMWDSWGIPMKYHGKYEFAGHDYPGSQQPNFWLKYSGRDQKPILTKEAVKRGTEIINRVMVLKLFSGAGGITGALGVDTREDRLIVFRAKAAILGTGTTTRLYPGPTPMWMFNWPFPSTLTGDGRVMAYHAGAEIANPEIPSHHVGAKWYARAGQATWAGVVRDPQGNPVGPFVTSPDKRYGDMIMFTWIVQVFQKKTWSTWYTGSKRKLITLC